MKVGPVGGEDEDEAGIVEVVRPRADDGRIRGRDGLGIEGGERPRRKFGYETLDRAVVFASAVDKRTVRRDALDEQIVPAVGRDVDAVCVKRASQVKQAVRVAEVGE